MRDPGYEVKSELSKLYSKNLLVIQIFNLTSSQTLLRRKEAAAMYFVNNRSPGAHFTARLPILKQKLEGAA